MSDKTKELIRQGRLLAEDVEPKEAEILVRLCDALIAMEASFGECHSFLSLLRYRGGVQWDSGAPIPTQMQVDHALGRAEKILYPKKGDV